MPPFGQAHKLLSALHLDTQAPAGGADPSDGQVVAWSTALGAWIAADPTGGGVTDHGLLSGLADDDHTQYPLLAGRSGGQTLKGGSAASEHLTLQSTAHATRGYVRAQDDLQLLSNIIRDSGGNARLTVGTASPHVTLTGDVSTVGFLSVRPPATGVGLYALKAVYSPTDQAIAYGLDIYLTQNRSGNGADSIGINGIVEGQASGNSSYNRGLAFSARHNSAYILNVLQGVYMGVQTLSNKGAVSYVMGGYLFSSFGANTPVTTSYGMWVRDFGHAQVGTAIGLQIDDQTNATACNVINAGPSTPYLRLIGGANPPANMTNLYLKEQATLRRVQWKDGAAVGAGDRVMVLV